VFITDQWKLSVQEFNGTRFQPEPHPCKVLVSQNTHRTIGRTYHSCTGESQRLLVLTPEQLVRAAMAKAVFLQYAFGARVTDGHATPSRPPVSSGAGGPARHSHCLARSPCAGNCRQFSLHHSSVVALALALRRGRQAEVDTEGGRGQGPACAAGGDGGLGRLLRVRHRGGDGQGQRQGQGRQGRRLRGYQQGQLNPLPPEFKLGS
jgi:hypothetical protein